MPSCRKSTASAPSIACQLRPMPMRSTSSTASCPARRPAVSTICTGTPSIWIVSLTRSRVVPGMEVTMASSAPASALSNELLPTLGWPASTTRRPSRKIIAAILEQPVIEKISRTWVCRPTADV